MARLGLLFALAIAMPAAAQERVGVATTVVGPVTVTRVAASLMPLKFKDDVFRNDRIATGEQAFARMLLGGKAIVTARERSVVTITEAPGLSTSGIRGTIVIAEVSGGVSTITVLRGLVDVYRRDPATGNAVGQATPVGARESVTVKGSVLPSRPQAISVDQASKLANDFTAPVQPVSPAKTIVSDEVSRATMLISTLNGGSTSGGDARSRSTTDVLAPATLASATTLATSPILSTPILATPANPTLSPTPTTSPTPIINLSPVLQPVPSLLKK